ncbi:7690_t:CDS:2, partial [Cetraspora pellucida]
VIEKKKPKSTRTTTRNSTHNSTPKTFKYVEPSAEQLQMIRESSKVQATHKATQVWVKVLEEFRADVGYQGKIEDVDSKSVLEDQLSKFVYAVKHRDSKEYYASSIRNCLAIIWHHLNEKSVLEKPSLSSVGLGKCNGADGLTINEVERILEYPTMQCIFSEGLLCQIFFYNVILLALHSGKHHNLRVNNFVKKLDG